MDTRIVDLYNKSDVWINYYDQLVQVKCFNSYELQQYRLYDKCTLDEALHLHYFKENTVASKQVSVFIPQLNCPAWMNLDTFIDITNNSKNNNKDDNHDCEHMKDHEYIEECNCEYNEVTTKDNISDQYISEGYAYLASPFTHENKVIQGSRFYKALKTVAYFFNKDITVYSPIIHSYPLYINKLVDNYENGFSTYYKHDFDMLENAYLLYVLKLEGYMLSEGVKEEIKYAVKQGKPVIYLNPSDLGINENNE